MLNPMMKKLIFTLAATSLIAACAKKSDNNNAAAVPAPAATPTPEIPKSAPGPKVANVPDGKKPYTNGKGGKQKESVLDVPALTQNYSGAADDLAVRFYEAKLVSEAGTQEVANLNKKRAEQILSASLGRGADGKDQLQLNLYSSRGKENKKVGRAVILKGSLDRRNKGHLHGAMGSTQISAHLHCLDKVVEGACQSTVAALHFKDGKEESKAFIIFRSSEALFNIRFPEERVSDATYVNFVKLFKNTAVNGPGDNVIKKLTMDSVEVVNGRSFMQMNLVTYGNEILVIKVPLIQQDDDGLLAEARTDISMDDAMALSQQEKFTTHYAQSITAVNMVENDGRGNISLNLSMKCLEGLTQDHIKLRLDRRIKAVAL